VAFSNVTPNVTPAQFLGDYPEFQDSKKYLPSTILYWLAVATILLNKERFPDPNVLYLATELLCAHEMVIEAMNRDTAEVDGWPGISKGVVSSESPGAVSINYDTAPALEEGAGNFNLTTYGTRLWKLISNAGAGPIQIGPSGDCGLVGVVPGSSQGGPAYSGPPCFPGITTFGG
jgi:hypothetical protein